jgi:hypothetical protein
MGIAPRNTTRLVDCSPVGSEPLFARAAVLPPAPLAGEEPTGAAMAVAAMAAHAPGGAPAAAPRAAAARAPAAPGSNPGRWSSSDGGGGGGGGGGGDVPLQARAAAGGWV